MQMTLSELKSLEERFAEDNLDPRLFNDPITDRACCPTTSPTHAPSESKTGTLQNTTPDDELAELHSTLCDPNKPGRCGLYTSAGREKAVTTQQACDDTADALLTQALLAFDQLSASEQGSPEAVTQSVCKARKATMEWWAYWRTAYAAASDQLKDGNSHGWQRVHDKVVFSMASKKQPWEPKSFKTWLGVLNQVRSNNGFRAYRYDHRTYIQHVSSMFNPSKSQRIDCHRIAMLEHDDEHLENEVWIAFSQLASQHNR